MRLTIKLEDGVQELNQDIYIHNFTETHELQ